jgi:predicted nucleic acid-binding protein
MNGPACVDSSVVIAHAYCLQLGLPLAARDQHFAHVDGLTVLDWFAAPAT